MQAMKRLEQLLCSKLHMTPTQGECMSISHGWQSSVATAVAPALDTHFREGREGLSGDVTVRSKAAGLPQSQLEAKDVSQHDVQVDCQLLPWR